MGKRKDFGNIIISSRNAKKLSQSELAKMIHVTRQAISRWENGVNFPDESVLPLLCEILEIDEKIAKVYCSNYDASIKDIEHVIAQERAKIIKKYRTIPFIIFSILIIAIIFIIILIKNSNYFVVYKLSIDSDDFTLDNGILIQSKVKNFFQFGTLSSDLILSDEDVIYKVRIFVKNENEIETIVDTTYDKSITLLEDYGYKEYFSNVEQLYENLFLDITVIINGDYKRFTFPIKLEKVIENDFRLYFKKSRIGDKNSFKFQEDDNQIIEGLMKNNYNLDENNFNYIKEDGEKSYIFSPVGNELICVSKLNNNMLNINYYIDKNYITVTDYNIKDGIYNINFEYFMENGRINCLSINCDGYDTYIKLILDEYKKISLFNTTLEFSYWHNFY